MDNEELKVEITLNVCAHNKSWNHPLIIIELSAEFTLMPLITIP